MNAPRYPTIVLAMWLAVLLLPPPQAHTQQRDLTGGLDTVIEEAMEAWSVPGVAVGILHEGEVIYERGFGYRDVDGELPVTPHTLFAIASVSKAFTAASLAALEDEGLLAWNTPVVEYLPDFKLMDPYTTALITPMDLLTHQSGLPRHDWVWLDPSVPREEIVHRVRYLEPNAALRERTQYQNMMVTTAGYLAGRVNGSTWEDLVQDHFLDPLGMERTNFSIDVMRQDDNHALPYGGGKGQISRRDFRNVDGLGPAGAINSSVEEMLRWLQFHLGEGTYNGERLLSEDNLAKLHEPHVMYSISARLPSEREAPYLMYSLGWVVEPFRGHRLLHHSGRISGYTALNGFMPDQDLAFVILTNKAQTPLPLIVMYELVDRVIGVDEVDWMERAEVAWANRGSSDEENDARYESTQPSHALEAYAGSYEHPAYGLLEIAAEDGALRVRFQEYEGALEHYHYDVFSFQGGPHGGTRLQFMYDVDGEIDRVAFPLEPRVSPIQFERAEEE